MDDFKKLVSRGARGAERIAQTALCKKVIPISLMRVAKVHCTMGTSTALFRQFNTVFCFLRSSNSNFHENNAICSMIVTLSC